jgi:hypothetical protein
MAEGKRGVVTYEGKGRGTFVRHPHGDTGIEERKEMTLHDSLYYATPEDIAFFEQATAGLPKRLPDEPYHCGPQNVAAFRYAVLEASKCSDEIHDTRSVSVVEIGFNLGHSAACFLALGAHVLSIDTRLDERVKSSIKCLERYGADFGFMLREFEMAIQG